MSPTKQTQIQTMVLREEIQGQILGQTEQVFVTLGKTDSNM